MTWDESAWKESAQFEKAQTNNNTVRELLKDREILKDSKWSRRAGSLSEVLKLRKLSHVKNALEGRKSLRKDYRFP